MRLYDFYYLSASYIFINIFCHVQRVIPIIKLLKKLFNFRKAAPLEPAIVPREQHIITRKNINPNALKVMYRLQDAGFSVYLVGGSVRDLLLDRHPKDFDVATNARPEQVKKLFRNCLLIGRRFRLAHIRFGQEIIEVATFRAAPSLKKSSKKHQTAEHGMLLRDNVYGTLAEDAVRRDFTINALYYNIADFSIVDYCGGFADLKDKTLRIIGDPRQRYHEDPVRLLRVIRFAGKLGFAIDPATREPIIELAPLLQHVPAARLFDEVLKLFHSGHASDILPLLSEYHLFEQLFPQLADCLTGEQAAVTKKIIALVCQNTDARINEDKTVSAGFLFASLLWQPFQHAIARYLQQGDTLADARHSAERQVISQQIKHITIPKRFSLMIKEIWDLQYYFEKINVKYVTRTVNHPRFRAAYDFLLVRAQASKDIQTVAKWWQKFYEADTAERQQLLDSVPKTSKRRRKRKKST